MNLINEYRTQFAWRDWQTIFDALPLLGGQTILDLGCAVGDQAAELVARGARVIGVDTNEELVHEARSRGLSNAEFRVADVRVPFDVGVLLDGVWCSFAAAYFPNLPAALALWTKPLRAGGWIALTEIDDLFGHEPLGSKVKSLFEGYAQKALAAEWYDFHMGRKLTDYLKRSGFQVSKVLTLHDLELSFDGPAHPDVIIAWRNRLARMTLLQDFCGADFAHLRDEFLGCLSRSDHRCLAKVCCCIATKQAPAGTKGVEE